MHAFDVLGDPIRRRILELLLTDDLLSGQISAVVGEDFGISQPAVSNHLRVLRESGFVRVRAVGTRRLYAVEANAMADVETWLQQFRDFWSQKLDSLETELARGHRQRDAAPP